MLQTRALPGAVTKRPEPLFRGTEPWEHDINNGYSSLLYADGQYKLYYSAGDKSFGGSIPGESSGSATLYATSQDGLVWQKPRLGRVPFGPDKSTVGAGRGGG